MLADIGAEDGDLAGLSGVFDGEDGAGGSAFIGGVDDVDFGVGGEELAGFLDSHVGEPGVLLGDDFYAGEFGDFVFEAAGAGVALFGDLGFESEDRDVGVSA